MRNRTVRRNHSLPTATVQSLLTQRCDNPRAPELAKAGLRHSLRFLERVNRERTEQLKLEALLVALYRAWLHSEDDDGVLHADQAAVARQLLKDSMGRLESAQMEFETRLEETFRFDAPSADAQ